ncbi:hypothetical protein GCM10025867_47400 (plasmid) [Frondihabitans sucicola]|uniref:Prepilin peptidase n=1 Tax=Frondihabitans sucicola TaxID=1268041 RepID=A0ABM8GVK3_9MICO|nr:A24 family peptidase [Frondihabitans sucicola]BDZ52499.1 hypothetical protein GCM10025867_47400 [Frondihabitans sucicola]
MSTETTHSIDEGDEAVILIDEPVQGDVENEPAAPWTPLFRHPSQVALTAAAIVVAIFASVHSGAPAGPLGIAAWVTLAAPVTVLALIDARVYRLPFVISVPMFLVVFALSAVASFIHGGLEQLGWMGVASGVPFAFGFAAWWFGKMGLGDVPVIASIGAALSLAGPGTLLGGLIYIPTAVALLLYLGLWLRTKLSPASWPTHGTFKGKKGRHSASRWPSGLSERWRSGHPWRRCSSASRRLHEEGPASWDAGPSSWSSS